MRGNRILSFIERCEAIVNKHKIKFFVVKKKEELRRSRNNLKMMKI